MQSGFLRTCESSFIKSHLTEFTGHFSLEYSNEGCCNYYHIFDKKDHREISSSLVLSLNKFAKQIHVSRFYPELMHEPCHKFMSATCFYLLVHHFAQCFDIEEGYKIYLETKSDVYQGFYQKLKDFSLKIKKDGLGSGNVDVWGDYHPVPCRVDSLCTRCASEPEIYE